jgi:hypothetical protein
MSDAKIRSLALLLLFTFVTLGCVDPRCPRGYDKRGDTCYRMKDAGAIDAGDDEFDGGDVEAGDIIEDETDVDTATDRQETGADAEDPADALPPGDGAALDPCRGSSGAAVCIGTVMHHCSAEGVTEGSDTCASAQQCQMGTAGDRCAPCAPGKFQCLGARLERCSNDGSGWELLTNCDSAALCNETAGACTDKACTPTTRVCSGDTLNGCNTSLTALAPIMTCDAGLCDQAQGECDVCIANAKECDQDTVVTCSADGQMATRSPCTQPTPKCTGAGRCVQCIGNTDCTGGHELCVGNSCVVQPYCGDGKITSGEACDPAAPNWNVWTCNAQCQATTTYTSCSGSTDNLQGTGCRTGEFCTLGVCVSRCNVPADCSPVPANGNLQASCINSVCFATSCSAASECAPGLVCSPPATSGWAPSTTNFCRGCSSTLRCPSGTTCRNLSPDGLQGRCVADDEL